MRTLVVGGSSSIGKQVVACLQARGDQVVATFANNSFVVPEGVQLLHLNLEQLDTLKGFADEAVKALDGSIDHVLLLPGILPGKNLGDYSAALIQKVMWINFGSLALVLQYLLPHMTEGGSVLAMSSISAQQGSYDPIYAASKAALIGLVKSMATASGKAIRCNAVAPGLVEDSAIYAAMTSDRQKIHRAQTPTGKLLSIADLAAIMVELTDTKWSQLNGATIPLNGGRYL